MKSALRQTILRKPFSYKKVTKKNNLFEMKRLNLSGLERTRTNPLTNVDHCFNLLPYNTVCYKIVGFYVTLCYMILPVL